MKYHNVSIRTTLIILATIVYASNCSSSGYRPHKTNGYALLRVGESPPQTAPDASKKEDPEEVNHARKRLNYSSLSSIVNEPTLKQPYPELLLATALPETARFRLERTFLGLRLATRPPNGSTLNGEEPRKNNDNANSLQQGTNKIQETTGKPKTSRNDSLHQRSYACCRSTTCIRYYTLYSSIFSR